MTSRTAEEGGVRPPEIQPMASRAVADLKKLAAYLRTLSNLGASLFQLSKYLAVSALIALAAACDDRADSSREGIQWVDADRYFAAQCWGGKGLDNTPTTVPVRLVVNRRLNLAYLGIISQSCFADQYGLKIEQVPRAVRISGSADLFRVISWSKLSAEKLAHDLRVEKVSLPPVHGISIDSMTELYDAKLEIIDAEIREPHLVSDFAIGAVSDLRRRDDLEPITPNDTSPPT